MLLIPDTLFCTAALCITLFYIIEEWMPFLIFIFTRKHGDSYETSSEIEIPIAASSAQRYLKTNGTAIRSN